MSTSSVVTSPSGLLTPQQARLDISPVDYQNLYNNTPFGFSHNLHELEIFQFDAICELAERYATAYGDFFVTGSAAAAGSDFFGSGQVALKPTEAIQRLDEQPIRILLKRAENHDPRFRALADQIIGQLRSMPGGLGNRPIQRMQSSIFITSAAATTPLHFDPEVNFFFQIEGDKTYHVYPPDDVAEPELENFYQKGEISICQVKLEERNPEKEQIYNLKAGHGFHQPQNSPHWVQTQAMRSISYSIVYETDVDQALGRTRAFNGSLRKIGMTPAAPGAKPALDKAKAEAVWPERFARKVIRRLKRG